MYKSPYLDFANEHNIVLEIFNGPKIEMNRQGFWYNGQLIEDYGEVYDKFKEWIILAHKADFGE